MENKLIGGAVGAVIMPVFEFFFGGGLVVFYVMIALLWFIGLDWVAGYRASKKDNSYASEYGIDGAFRTGFMLMLPAGGHFIDMAFGLPSLAFGFLAGMLLWHTLHSVAANAIRAGWGRWVPEAALKKIAEWVKPEIDSKENRSAMRQAEKGGKS